MPIGRPAISTPRALELRAVQLAVDNIRERFQAVDQAVILLQATTTALAAGTSVSTRLTRLQREVDALALDLSQLLALFDLEAVPADGDVLTWSDDQNQYIPAAPTGGAGGVLPVVTGDVPPIFVYLEDGALVYAPVEA